MSKINIGRLIDQRAREDAADADPTYLCTIPDAEVLTRDVFKRYLRQYPKAKRFGFSKKHTAEITKLRQSNGVDHIPDKVYGLPVVYDAPVTYLKE